MDRNDSFNRTYPVPGFVLFLIMAVIPALAAIFGAVPSLPSLFSDKALLQTMAYSALLALACSTASLLLGLPGAHILAVYSIPLKRFFKWLLSLAIVLPSTVIALFPSVLEEFSAKLGLALNLPYPWLATGIVLTLANTPIVIILVGIWWSRLDDNIEKCAASLGMRRSYIFRTLTIPRLREALFGSASLVFVRSLSSMAVVMATAEGTPFVNAASSSYSFWNGGDPAKAGALALFTLAVSLPLVLPFVSMANNSDRIVERKERSCRRPRGLFAVFASLYLLVSFAVTVLPVAATVLRSIRTDSGFSVSVYVNLFNGLESEGLKPAIYSVLIAFSSAIVSTFIALRLSKTYSRFALTCLALSPCIIGLGYAVLSTSLEMVPGLVFAILANVSVSTPLAVFLLHPFLKRIPATLDSTSRSLGYTSAFTFRKIDRKIVGNKVAAAFLIAFMTSLGEFGVPLFLKGRTLTTLLFSNARADAATACALASILILLCSIILIIVASLLKGKEGEHNA